MRIRSGSVLVSGSTSVIEAIGGGGGVFDHVAAGSAAIGHYDIPDHCHHGCRCASRAQPNGGKPTPWVRASSTSFSSVDGDDVSVVTPVEDVSVSCSTSASMGWEASRSASTDW